MSDTMKHVSRERLINDTGMKEKITNLLTKWEFILVLLFIGDDCIFFSHNPVFSGLLQPDEYDFQFYGKGHPGPAHDLCHNVRRY